VYGNAGANPGLPSNREWGRNPHKSHWLRFLSWEGAESRKIHEPGDRLCGNQFPTARAVWEIFSLINKSKKGVYVWKKECLKTF